MKTAILTLCVLCVFAALRETPAQTGFSENQPIKPVRGEVPRTIDEMNAMLKASKRKDDVPILGWDKFSDTGMIMTKPENLVGTWEGVGAIMSSGSSHSAGQDRILLVDIETQFPGKTLTDTPLKFILVFTGESPNAQFAKTGDMLYLLLDNETRIVLEAAAKDADIVKWNRVDEKLAYVISREDLARVAAAKLVELRIGAAKPRKFGPKLQRHFQAVLDVTKLDPVAEARTQ